MIELESFILETTKYFSTPDYVDIQGVYSFSWCDNGKTFIINSVAPNKIIMGERMTHWDMVDSIDSYERGKYGIPLDYNGRYEKVNWSEKSRKADWKNYKSSLNETATAIYGRAWYLAEPMGIKSYDDWCNSNHPTKDKIIKGLNIKGFPIIVSFWDELTTKQYNTLVPIVVNELLDKFSYDKKLKISDCDIFVTTNNGMLKPFDLETGWVKTNKRTKESQVQQKLARAIHLASQEEKRKFFDAFKKSRDEKNQKELYNHTKSKTEAEYRSIKYQESLMQSLEDFINEKQGFLVKKHVDAKNNVEYIDSKNIKAYKKRSKNLPQYRLTVDFYKKNSVDVYTLIFDIEQLLNNGIDGKNHVKLFIDKLTEANESKTDYDRIYLMYGGDVLGFWEHKEGAGWSMQGDYKYDGNKGTVISKLVDALNNI